MRKIYSTLLITKSYYWNKLEELCYDYKIDNEFLSEFLISLNNFLSFESMSLSKFNAYSRLEKEAFLKELKGSIIDDYKHSDTNDYDYWEYYDSFVTDVINKSWFRRIINTFEVEIRPYATKLKEVKVLKRRVEITYS